MLRKTLLALATLAALPSAQAFDLVQAWQAAQTQDRALAVARAAQLGAEPKRGQAQALWRPSLMLQAGVGQATQESQTRGAQFSAPGLGTISGADFNTSVTTGTSSRWALQASQPLYNPERRAQAQQLGVAADLADQAWRAAQQGLMLQTAQRYFELALAAERVRALEQQLGSVERAATEAQDRFKLGAAPILDSHEAQARLAGLRAELLMAQTELSLKRRVLADSTGLPEGQLAVRLPAAGPAPATLPLEAWQGEAASQSPELQMRRLGVEMARQEASKHGLRAAPRLDLVAQAGREHLSGSGAFSAGAAQTGSQRMIGLQLNVPLYTGGMRSAREREALQQLEQAQAELALAQQQLEQAVRSSWLNLQVGQQRLLALEAALKASGLRADATELGRSVGDRTLLDQLNADNERTQARLGLAQARVALVMEQLRLAMLAGKLDESLLTQASAPR